VRGAESMGSEIKKKKSSGRFEKRVFDYLIGGGMWTFGEKKDLNCLGETI